MRENEKRKLRVIVDNNCVVLIALFLKSNVGVRGFVKSFEIGTLNRKGCCCEKYCELF